MEFDRLLKVLADKLVPADVFPEFPHEKYRPSAVLIPLVRRNDTVNILLTKRNENLQHHPGQVCFPGGKVDSVDFSPAETAMRECMEELGIEKDKIKIHGMMKPIKVPTGFFLIPVVGEIEPDYKLKLQHDEVELAFEISFSHLKNAENYVAQKIFYLGRNHRFLEIKHESHYIWGATAKILRKLSKLA